MYSVLFTIFLVLFKAVNLEVLYLKQINNNYKTKQLQYLKRQCKTIKRN